MTAMTELAARLCTIIETERQRFGVPGVAVLVLKDGEVVIAEGFGHRDVARDLPMTADTLLPIGSSTKTFTAALCAALVDTKQIEWDAPIRDHFPTFRMRDPIANELLSFRDCLSHRSGLPRHDLLWYRSDAVTTRDDIVAALAHLEPTKPFREAFQYNNLLYITAGTLAGRLLGGSYEDAVSTQILKPLGMHRTNFDIAPTLADPDHSGAYTDELGTTPVRAIPHAALGVAGPAGNINSSVNELLPWVRTLLGLGVDGAEPLLSRSVLNDLKRPTMPLPDSPMGNPTGALPVAYGLGLDIGDYRGVRYTQHGGNIDGFSSQVMTVEEHGIAIVALTNLHGTALRDALPVAILDELLGFEPLPHGERLQAAMKEMLELTDLAKKAVEKPSDGLPNVRPLTDFVGGYSHPAYGTFVVGLEGEGEMGSLTAQYRNFATTALLHSTLDIFRFALPRAGEPWFNQAQFMHDLTGTIESVRIPFEATGAPIIFVRQPNQQ